VIRSALSVTKATPLARRGLVVAEHPAGALVGARVLERGGNAVDAAVAAALAMTVVEPFMSSLAGGGTMLVHLARRGETRVVDFNVEAPAACHEASYALAQGRGDDLFPWRRVAEDANVFGPRAVAVPGTVAGLALALRRFGTMSLGDAAAPAVALARDGFVPDWYQALATAQYCRELAAFPETARTYLRDGHYVYRPPALDGGDRFVQPELARSLELIGREGPEAFYRGPIAQAIADLMRGTGGFLAAEDLARYEPRVVEPLVGRYRDLELAFSPGATGGITALQTLTLLAQFPASRVGYRTAGGLHRRAEAVRLAFLDRFAHLGDPAMVKAPWRGLVAEGYARAVARGLAAGRRAERPAGPDPWDHEDGVGGRPRAAAPRGAGRPATDCTTHVCAVDGQRNMVSLTNTAVSLWGSRMVVPGTGILLANGMIWFDPEPGRPNSIAPGKRPLVNMVPVLAFKAGAPHLALGAPGGRKIVSAVPQVLANLVDQRESPQAAIEAPRLHTEGEDLWVDDRVGPAVLRALERLGHRVVAKHQAHGTFYFARPVAIRVTRRGLEAGLEHLNQAAAAGT